MSLIALDASGSQAGLALLNKDGDILERWVAPLKPGLIETLPIMLQNATVGRGITDIAVGIGPGSFTGLRTSIALAQGFAAASGATLWGIPAWDSYCVALPDLDRPLWVALRARRGRLFLLRNHNDAESFAEESLPIPPTAVAIAGEEAILAAAYLTKRGADVTLTSVRLPDVGTIGLAARQQKHAGTPPKAAIPLYVDPPEAKLPASGLRPTPL